MIDKIITLDNNEKYFIIIEKKYENDLFYVGVRVFDDKWTNDFKLFLEKKNNNEVFLEVINDEKVLKVIVNSYLLESIK